MNDWKAVARVNIAATCGIAALAFAVLTPFVAAPFQPGYSHTQHYISELGQTGAPAAAWVNWAGFFPTGVLVFAFLWAIRGRLPLTPKTLWLLSSLGWAYVLSAFYPCDPGCPVTGSKSQIIHNLTAIVGYPAQIVGLWQAGWSFRNTPDWKRLGLPTLACSVLTAVGFALMIAEACEPWRGLLQRVVEFAAFGWIALVGLLLWKPSQS